MAFFGNRGHTRSRVKTALVTAGALGAFQALAMVGATSASAVTAGNCQYNPSGTGTVTIQQNSGDTTTVGVRDMTPGGSINEIWITADTAGAQDCGSATTANTTSIVLLGSGVTATNETFTVDNSDTGGSFGAIAFSLDMGNSGAVPPGDTFIWTGRNGPDDVTVTDTTFTSNGGNGVLVGVESMTFNLLNGTNTFDGSGTTSVPLTVNGGTGNDTMTGGNGNDWLNANASVGTDTLYAGSSRADGQDLYYGGATGFTTVVYVDRTANNWLSNDGVAHSGEGTCPSGVVPTACEGDLIGLLVDEIVAGSGNDTLVAGTAGTWLDPGPGDDIIDAASLSGIVIDNGSWGSAPTPGLIIDQFAGTQTGNGNDTIKNDPGTIGFVGGEGDDTFVIVDKTAFGDFCGDGGHDTVDASATGVTTVGWIIDLTSGSFDGAGNCPPYGLVPGSGDTTEDVIGGVGDDTLIGNTLQNNLNGGDGNDTVWGSPPGTLGDGGDTLVGGMGNDSFFGGTGPDSVSFKAAPSGETIDESLGFATGGEGEDTFLDYIEKLTGSKFKDDIKTGPTGGGSGLNFWVKALGGNDTVTGSNGNDTLAGGAGKDNLLGAGGNDTLNGAGGNDHLYGDAGTDVGNGGKGKDRCIKVEIKNSCGSKKHPKRPGLSTYAAVSGKMG